MAIAVWRSASPRVPTCVTDEADIAKATSVSGSYAPPPPSRRYTDVLLEALARAVSENETAQAPVPRFTDADRSSGSIVSAVPAIAAAAVDAAMSWSDRSLTAPAPKYTCGVAGEMAACLATSRSLTVMTESVSDAEVTSEASPKTLSGVPPLAAVLPVMKIFSRSTSEPSFTDSLNFSVSTPVPSSRAGPFGAAVTSVGAVVSAVRVNW